MEVVLEVVGELDLAPNSVVLPYLRKLICVLLVVMVLALVPVACTLLACCSAVQFAEQDPISGQAHSRALLLYHNADFRLHSSVVYSTCLMIYLLRGQRDQSVPSSQIDPVANWEVVVGSSFRCHAVASQT